MDAPKIYQRNDQVSTTILILEMQQDFVSLFVVIVYHDTSKGKQQRNKKANEYIHSLS
jgi:hypothetical protein